MLLKLAGLPRAGANSKPHHYKQNVQKKNDLPAENMGFKAKTVWRFQKKEEQKHYSPPFKKIRWNSTTLNALIEHGPR